MDAPKKYQMNISNTVLYHLGINLYSNIPAVLSEVVANSWDADATNVYVEIEKDRITIADDGQGMTLKDINEKYLLVGYPRRIHNEAVTGRYKRKVMGRKGIGKLSLFLIAETVKVETLKDGEKNGFVMSKQAIDKHIKKKNEQPYSPQSLSESKMALDENGTRIVLTDLKKQISKAHSNYLRKRIARRFSIIGAEDNFNVFVDGSPVEITDRDYFHKIQFLWHYGDESEKYINLCNNLENPEHNEKRDGTIKVTDEDNIENLTGSVNGWIGTVRKPMELTDTNVAGEKDVNENLNKIVIMVRGKLAQENILDDFRQSGFYTKYLIGEIHADFLDMDNLDDIATTSRQEIIKDNPRYDALKGWIQKELYHIRGKWDEWRSEKVKEEVYQIPAIKAWLNELKPEERKQAESLFSKIGGVYCLRFFRPLPKGRLCYNNNLIERSIQWRNAENSPLSLKLKLFSKSSAVRLPKQKCVGVIISTKINSHSGSDSCLKMRPCCLSLLISSPAMPRSVIAHLEQLVGRMAVALDIQKKLLTGLD